MIGLSFDLEDLNLLFEGLVWERGEMVSADYTRQCEALLDWLAARDAKATFFVLGSVSEQTPQLIRRIASEGHEIGVHGFSHEYLSQMSPQRFAGELRRTREVLEDVMSGPILGYRAPNLSLGRGDRIRLMTDVLVAQGFRYDSSVNRGQLRRIGCSPRDNVPRLPNGLYVVPVTVVGRGFPVGHPVGGGYFRMGSRVLMREAVRRSISRHGYAVTYHHNYDFDPPAARPSGRTEHSRLHLLRLELLRRSCGPAVRVKLDAVTTGLAVCPLRELLPAL